VCVCLRARACACACVCPSHVMENKEEVGQGIGDKG
jgi:hypothetical protein